MKKLVSWLVILVLLVGLVGSFPASAAGITWSLEYGRLTISGTGDMDDYEKPEDVPWYSSRSKITTVVISDGVTSIGKGAFNDCKSLVIVTMPDSVKKIGDYAFQSCTSLQTITIGDGVETIGSDAFGLCYNLSTVHFGKNVKSLGSCSFWYSGIQELVLPESLESIGSQAFYQCTSLKSVTFPNHNLDLSYAVSIFENCTSLKEVTVPAELRKIRNLDFGYRLVNYQNVPISGFRVRGYDSTCAEAYAKEGGFEFISLGSGLPGIAKLTASGKCSDTISWRVCNGVLTISGTGALDQYGMFGPEAPWSAYWEEIRYIVVGEGITKIDGTAFYPLSNAECIYLPSTIDTGSAFYNFYIENMEALQEIFYAGSQEAMEEVLSDYSLPLNYLSIFRYPNIAVPQQKLPFVDVPDNAYYTDAVCWALENEITAGTGPNTFSPEAGCTRGQVVTFLWRAAGCPKPEGTENPFTDVPKGEYYYDAVLWAVAEGITKGTSDTTFSPNTICTRGQIVTFLYRADGSPAVEGAGNPFTDLKKGEYYYDAVLWAVSKGVTKGTTETTFSPNDTCTRAQIVTFLYRDRT